MALWTRFGTLMTIATIWLLTIPSPVSATTLSYVSGKTISAGSPVSSTFDVKSSLPSGHIVSGAQITANFTDNDWDHYFSQTVHAGGNQYNFVYLNPPETAQLTMGLQSLQANSPYSYIRYYAWSGGPIDYYDVVDGYGGNFSISAALTQSVLDNVNTTGSLEFLVAALIGNFRLLDVTLSFNTVLAATPLPGALIFFGTGLGIMGLARWWRQRGVSFAGA